MNSSSDGFFFVYKEETCLRAHALMLVGTGGKLEGSCEKEQLQKGEIGVEGLGMDEWVAAGSEGKDKTMKELLARLPRGFGFEGVRTFERWGRGLETGVFVYGGREFVFVPGGIAKLGWGGGEEKLDPQLRAELLEGLEEYEIEDVEAFLRDVTSPAREVVVGPLLVEADTHEAGWERVDWEEVRNDSRFAEDIDRWLSSGSSELTIHKILRLERANDGIQAFHFSAEELEDWLGKWMTDGFRLPTENEWEYLHGCGSTTLFPWGDVFDYTMKLEHFDELNEGFLIPSESSEDRGDRLYDLEQRNRFGLFFSGDPYIYELTQSGLKLYGKGGDGGGMICGGEGRLLGYLPATMTAYRNMAEKDEDKGERWQYLAPYSVYRRVLDLSLLLDRKKHEHE